ncbi:MAG TPA: cold shock domain-containing protein [Rubrobacteraceae bacterium]|nr:cold shock domain-containing protein [Rubrobacteraceae bacterium]
MADSKKRIALKPHMEQIREWVEAGKTDDWIADALGTSASSVQSFRSRNDIYRRERGPREPEKAFEGVLDHGERDGWGLWLDPAIAEDPIWKEHWATVDAVIVKVAEDSIVLEADRSERAAPATEDGSTDLGSSANGHAEAPAESPEDGATGELPRERGRVKWFDADKGYGFLIRPTGDDLFVHHSEVQGDVASLSPNADVEYEVGRNDRGPNARRVRLVG